MSDYLKLGFNKSLLREASIEGSPTELQSEYIPTPIGELESIDNIFSLNRSFVIDLENELFSVNQGQIRRIEIGKLTNGKIGILLKDNQGNILLNISGDENVIQSANGKTFFNLAENKLQIADERGTTLIDSTGLVSTANFMNDYVSYPTMTQVTSSDTPVDVTNSMLAPFELTRQTKVLIFMTAYARNSLADSSTSNETAIYVRDAITGRQIMLTNVAGSPITGGAVHNTSVANSVVELLEKGSHQLKLQFHRSTAGEAQLYSFSLGYLILGT